MSKSAALAAMAVAAFTFVHFKNPATGAKLFVLNANKPTGTIDGDDGYARDQAGNLLPIGVKKWGPGSEEYRKAEARIATENMRAGAKKLTGEKLHENATTLLSRTVFEYVNFGYSLTDDGVEQVVTASTSHDERMRVNTALFNDPAYVAVREQVLEADGDLGNFAKTA
jgi:hypothetical protein